MTDKVIVTNVSVLKDKYGSDLKTIRAAIRKLIAADKKRGFDTRLVALDNASVMKKLAAPVVTDPGDPALEALVGKRLRCTGTLAGYTFLITRCEDVE